MKNFKIFLAFLLFTVISVLGMLGFKLYSDNINQVEPVVENVPTVTTELFNLRDGLSVAFDDYLVEDHFFQSMIVNTDGINIVYVTKDITIDDNRIIFNTVVDELRHYELLGFLKLFNFNSPIVADFIKDRDDSYQNTLIFAVDGKAVHHYEIDTVDDYELRNFDDFLEDVVSDFYNMNDFDMTEELMQGTSEEQ